MTPRVPFIVHWYLTKRCNLKCTHCYNYEDGENPRARAGELTRDEALALAQRLADDGVFEIHFIGGEVYLVPWFEEVLELCVSLGVACFVATNGLLVTEARAKRLAELDVGVQVSLDGASAATHDAVRGRGTFVRTCGVLSTLARSGVRAQVAMTVMQKNIHEVDALVDLALSLGLSRIKLSAYIPAGRSFTELSEVPSPPVLKRLFEDLQAREESSGGAFTVDYPCFMGHAKDGEARRHWRPDDRATRLSCGAGMDRGVIWENGSVGACDFLRDDEHGDLRKDSFADIWTSDAFARWRALERVGGKCGSCGYQKDCGFGCRAAAYYGGGNFFGGDPNCISAPPEGIAHPFHEEETRRPSPKRHLHVLA